VHRLLTFVTVFTGALVALVLSSAALAAQDNGPPTLPDSGGAGAGAGGGGMTTQGEECPACEPEYEIRVTPDGQDVVAAANTGGLNAVFTVKNWGTETETVTLTCSDTGGVVCGSVTPSSVVLDSRESAAVSVGYAVGSTGGALTLHGWASSDASDTGSYDVLLTAPPQVAFTNLVGNHLDRGACFTAGAGEAAGVSCGDLFVVHGMPAYRTLGRDRSLSLYYNSAAATGLALVAARVTQPSGVLQPTAVKAVLTVGSGGTMTKDSATYGAWSTGSRQVALGLGRGSIGSLPTGLYPVTLAVKNVYSGTAIEAVATGELVVVNRGQSEYGQGWSLLGVEQVLLNQPVNAEGRARLLWVAGDGSARVYTETGAGTNVFLGAPGAEPDSLVRYSNGSTGTWWYRRDLKHGVKVHFDETGRHRETHSRVGAKTTFHWSGVTPRLDSITVPPNDGTVRRYQLAWSGSPARLVSITDPGGRVLSATMTGGLLTKLKDPDTLSTRFSYTSGRLAARVVPRKASKGDSAVTKYTYGTSSTHGRLTKVVNRPGIAGGSIL
jgi:hypothetical protein